MSVQDPGRASESIHQLIRAYAADRADAVALLAPDRPALNYKNLWKRIEGTIDSLSAAGVQRGDCIATVLPDGPEAAIAGLAISAFAVCAPIYAGFQLGELEMSLRTLEPAAVLIQAGAEIPARVAKSLEIPIIEVSPATHDQVGLLRFGARIKRRPPLVDPQPDAALILQTSGTTSRPKLVVHTRKSLYWATHYIGKALGLTPEDRCLILAPLPHSLGLTGGLLSTLAWGGSAICPRGFRVDDFFRCLDEFSPTWYGAVPKIHESIVESAPKHEESIKRSRLRFVRSAGAAASQQFKAEAERILRCRFVDTYGMSEAPPIAMDPLPPAECKPGSVGISAGAEIEILDEHGASLPRSEIGEVVVRGPNISPGYWNNPAASRDAFVNGWFRTGDLGYVDEDGFVFLTGRVREMINRGGSKISPAEVDEALQEHPAVAKAVTFAAPDSKLGEEIAVAVVLRLNMSATAADLQSFVASRLTPHKVPRHLIFLNEIPCGPTGKVSRIKLAQILAPNIVSPMPALGDGLGRRRPALEAPGSEREQLLAEIWSSVLSIEEVGIHDNFFDCGGDSIRGAEMLARVAQAAGIESPPLSILLMAPTIATLARVIDDPTCLAASSRISPIQTRGAGTPFFCIGDGLEFRHMAVHLDGQPFFGIHSHRFEDDPLPLRIEDLAASCRETLQSIQPHGPYMLGGWCFAGVVAYEVARQLESFGERVSLLALFDSRNLLRSRASRVQRLGATLTEVDGKVRYHLRNALKLDWRQGLKYVQPRLNTVASRVARTLWRVVYRRYAAAGRSMPKLLRSRRHSQSLALDDYVPQPFGGRIVLFWAGERPPVGNDADSEWGPLAKGGLVFHEIPGDHLSMLQEPNVSLLARKFSDSINEAEGPKHRSVAV